MSSKLTVPFRELEMLANEPESSLEALASEGYLDDPSDEEILAHLRQNLIDSLAGKVRPAHEVLDEIERELGLNGKQG